MHYKIVPKCATLTFRWEPALAIVTPTDTSVLNLSNWNIQLVITYDSKPAPKPEAVPSEEREGGTENP